MKRRVAEFVVYVLLTLGPVAIGIAGIDAAVGSTQTGAAILRAGVVLLLAGVLAWFVVRPQRQVLARMVAVFSGLWSMAAFAIFIGWRIGTAAESAQACEAGEREECYMLGVRKEKRGRFDEAAVYLKRGCELGQPRACFELGGLLLAGRANAEDSPADLFVLGCEGGVAPSCERAGIALRDSDAERAVALFRRGCELGSASACSALATTTPSTP
jgi:hypothetical protein